MSGFITNSLKSHLLAVAFRAVPVSSKYYLALALSTSIVNSDIKTFGELIEVQEANGYLSGGIELTPGVIDFPVLNEDDLLDAGSLSIRTVSWLASGGPIPDSTDFIRYAILTGEGAVIADRPVFVIFDLERDIKVVDTQTLNINDSTVEIGEPTL